MGRDGTGEGAARTLGAGDLLILLEVVTYGQKRQARYGSGGDQQKADREQNSAGEGHAQGENRLVADGVQQANSQNCSERKRQDQGDEDKRLGDSERGPNVGVRDFDVVKVVILMSTGTCQTLVSGNVVLGPYIAHAKKIIHKNGGVEQHAGRGRVSSAKLPGERAGPEAPWLMMMMNLGPYLVLTLVVL